MTETQKEVLMGAVITLLVFLLFFFGAE